MTHGRALVLISVLAAVGVALACTTLGNISLGVCGNAIVDPNAECDTYPVGANACYPPDAGARACHLACGDGGACAIGSRCGVDAVCRTPKGTFHSRRRS